MIQLALTRDELLFAAAGGAQRQLDALLRNRGSHFEHLDSWMNHIHGAMAELAVAKHYGRFWFPCYDDPLAVNGDVGNWQVRAAVRRTDCLLLRDKDVRKHLQQPFILVHVEIPRFTLLGWIRCRDGLRDEYKRPAEGEKPNAWFVPQSALTPIGARAPSLAVAA